MIGSQLHRCAYLGFSLLLGLIFSAAAVAQGQGSVSASLSASQIAFEDSVNMQVLARGLDGPLDTRELEQVFDITGRSESSQMNIINGVNDSLRRWDLQLTPRETGTLTVPPVRVGSQATQELTLVVGSAPTGADRVLFVELDIDEPRPWVQQQVYLTLRIFHRININRYHVDTPQAAGITVIPIDGEITGEEERDGVRYNVLEKRFAAFPQQSGELVLDPVTLTALVPADPTRVRTLLSPTRRVTRRSDAIRLDVQARPENVTASWWLPSRSIDVTGQWLGDVSEARVGEPISRQLNIRAEGVLSTQLPDLDQPDIDGASIYADAPSDQTVAEIDGLITERSVNWAVIPQRQGPLDIPAFEIEWFDTVSGTVQVARVPEQTIDVQAASSGAPAAPVAESLSSNQPLPEPLVTEETPQTSLTTDAVVIGSGAGTHWRRLAAAAFLGWLVTALVFAWREWGRRRTGGYSNNLDTAGRADNSDPLGDPLRLLKRAAAQSDHALAAEAVRAWARQTGVQGSRVAGLGAIADSTDNKALASTLRQLDVSLYGSDSGAQADVDLGWLYRELKGMTNKQRAGKSRKSTAALPTL